MRVGRTAQIIGLVIVTLATVLAVRSCGHSRRDATDQPRPAAHSSVVEYEGRLRAIERASTKLPLALPTLRLHGRVVDTAAVPVAGATVALGSPARQVTSAADGTFALDGLFPGRYAVEARKGALVGGPLAVQLDADRELTLVLRRGAQLRVEVVSAADQRPIANAEIRIALLSMYDHGGEQQARTDATGIAVLDGVTLVAHTIWVGADGFAELSDTVDPMSAQQDQLRFRVELEPGGTVRGRVVDAESRQPIANAAVDGFEGDQRIAARRDDRHRLGDAHPYMLEVRGTGVRTDDAGTFRIGLRKGPWTVGASHPSYATTGAFVAVGDRPVDIEIAMERGIAVRGVVVTESDLPVAGAEVEVRWQHGGRVDRTVRADGRGRFELVGLAAAPLEILARTAQGSSTPVLLDLSRARSDDELILVLANTAEITGTVVAAGRPLAAAQIFYVEVANRAAVHPAVVNTDEQGRFRITGLARERTYALTAMPHQDGDSWPRPGSATVVAGADVTIEIPADGSIRGHVEVSGAGVAEVTVEIEGNTPARPLDRSGNFQFAPVPPGPRTLLVRGPRIAEHRVTFELGAGEQRDVGTIRLARGRTLAGRVLGPDDRPMSDAQITVRSPGGDLRTMTDRLGAFALVVPGDQEIVVEARGWRGGNAQTTVPARGPANGLVLRFSGGDVEGEITSGSAPVIEAMVLLERADSSDPQPAAYTQTDGAGYFRIKLVEPGRYDLVVVHPDASGTPVRYTRPLEVGTGQTIANVDVSTLEPVR